MQNHKLLLNILMIIVQKELIQLYFSSQHDPNLSINRLREIIREEIINKTLPKELIDNHTKFLINPAGRFEIGGPVGDCGLTGRKNYC